MIDEKLVTFLTSILGEGKLFQSKSEMYFRCPLCNRSDGIKKLAINLGKKSIGQNGETVYLHWHCWRNTTHRGKNLFQLLKAINADVDKYRELKSILNITDISGFNNILNENISQPTYNTQVILPREFKFLLDKKDNPHYRNAYNYIVKRGLTKSDIIKYGIGYCDSGQYSGYIIIPSFGGDANINYFVARSFYNSDFKYKMPSISKNIIFNELFINWSYPITICEGVFDAMSIKRNAIPILGKYIQPVLKHKIIKENVKDIYISLDSDAISDSIKIMQEFIKSGINIHYVKLDKKDPAEIGFKKMCLLIKDSNIINFDDLIKLKLSI